MSYTGAGADAAYTGAGAAYTGAGADADTGESPQSREISITIPAAFLGVAAGPPSAGDKLLCIFNCMGSRRGCTRRKIRFMAEVLILATLLTVDIAVALSDLPTGGDGLCERGVDRYLALANVIVIAVARPPDLGRVRLLFNPD